MDVLNALLSYVTLVHATAGAAGSLFALALFYPLDLARTRLQVDAQQAPQHTHHFLLNILREEGPRALFSGCYPVLVSQCCSNFVYFYIYTALKHLFISDVSKSNPLIDVLLAYIAAAINVLITNPLWVANTRLRLQGVKLKMDQSSAQRYRGLFDALRNIVAVEGMKALWNGTTPSLILATNPSIHFMVYESLKRNSQLYFHEQHMSGWVYFVMGAVAKMTSTVATYPLQVIQSQLRTSHSHHKSILVFIITHLRRRDVLSLYKGLETKLIQTVLTAATMFMLYEKIVYLVFYLMGVQIHHESQT